MSQNELNLREDLIEDEDHLESIPNELHQLFEDQTYKYFHSRQTKIFFYTCIALNSLDFVLLFIEYIILLKSNKYYYNLSLKSRIISMIIFFCISMLGLLLFILVNITGIYQHYKKYFYCTKSRLNYFGTMTLLLLLIDGALIVSNILAMRELLPSNCNDNEEICNFKYCLSTSDDSNQFAIDYHFNHLDKQECFKACALLINKSCRIFSPFSYIPVIFSSILFIFSLILIKIVCLTEEKEIK